MLINLINVTVVDLCFLDVLYRHASVKSCFWSAKQGLNFSNLSWDYANMSCRFKVSLRGILNIKVETEMSP